MISENGVLCRRVLTVPPPLLHLTVPEGGASGCVKIILTTPTGACGLLAVVYMLLRLGRISNTFHPARSKINNFKVGANFTVQYSTRPTSDFCTFVTLHVPFPFNG